MSDCTAAFAAAIREAASARRPLRICGSGSKDFYGNACAGEALDVTTHAGIVDYEPTELVITARGGTPLATLEATLAKHGQTLAFEPPHFGPRATLGGCVAAGLSGPRRAYAGALRDFVLGVRLLDGKGDDLHFGGRVMKNVAGFDVSRLIAGSLGTLGVVLEVSLKVLPRPAAHVTLRQPLDQAAAVRRCNALAGLPLPLSATAWLDDTLWIRLAGAASAVAAATRRIGGDVVPAAEGEAWWASIREQTAAFFAGDATPLWRLSVPATTPPLPLVGPLLSEWGGALRWLRTSTSAANIRSAVAKAGGHATLFRGAAPNTPAFHPLAPPLVALHRRLQQVFDPAGILNRGRLFADG